MLNSTLRNPSFASLGRLKCFWLVRCSPRPHSLPTHPPNSRLFFFLISRANIEVNNSLCSVEKRGSKFLSCFFYSFFLFLSFFFFLLLLFDPGNVEPYSLQSVIPTSSLPLRLCGLLHDLLLVQCFHTHTKFFSISSARNWQLLYMALRSLV